MGKPSFTIWVGWKRDSFDAQLQEDDYEKFPKELKALYKGELSTLQALSGVIIDGLKFEIIDSGNRDNADCGEICGFGVEVYNGWLDSGTTEFKYEEVHQKILATLQQMTSLTDSWGVKNKPQVLCSCGYNS